MKNNQLRILIIGLILSGILVIMFPIFEDKGCKFLDLEVKWIIVSAVPLIIVLLWSGLIQGVEASSRPGKTRMQRTAQSWNKEAAQCTTEKLYIRQLKDWQRQTV